jgi:hypothetical protein
MGKREKIKLLRLFKRYGVFQRKEDRFIKKQYTKELIEEIINLFGLEIASKSVMTPFNSAETRGY